MRPAVSGGSYPAQVRSLGWHYPFRNRRWSELEADYEKLARDHPGFGYLLEIVRSIRQSGVENSLMGLTSMADLIVAAAPASSPPFDTVAVRAPGFSLAAPAKGCVLIEHLSVAGHNDRIERPVEEATPLFWRFVIEKFGIHPEHRTF